MRVRAQFVAALLVAAVCLATAKTPAGEKLDPIYARVLAKWRASRETELRRDWLPLAGLFWLKEGETTFGSAADNKIVLPKGPAHAGVFGMKEGGKVGVVLLPGVVATVNGKRVKQTPMLPQPPGPPTVLELGTLRMHVIVRPGNKVGIRLKDMDSPAMRAFHGISTFPADTKWRFLADWVPSPGKKVPIVNVLNDISEYESPGVARFTVDGKPYTLRAVFDGEDYFFIFADQTNGKETYGAGRYVYSSKPIAGKVMLDFNQAFTPPCGYTPYATCPLPPPENKLPFAIPAGERYTKH